MAWSVERDQDSEDFRQTKDEEEDFEWRKMKLPTRAEKNA